MDSDLVLGSLAWDLGLGSEVGAPRSKGGWGKQALTWAGGRGGPRTPRSKGGRGKALAGVGGRGGGTAQYRPFKKLSKNPSRQSLVREKPMLMCLHLF